MTTGRINQPVPAATAPDPAAAAAAAAAATPRLQQPRWPAWTGPPSTPRLPRELALTASVRVALRKLWRLRWDNAVKEVYWRLALNGLATAERMSQPEAVCLCGAACPGRAHHYWECPIAQAVVRAMLDSLPAEWCARPADGAPRLHREHVWLMFAPPPAARRAGARRLHSGVWRVVCLAALAAMDTGRRAANLAALQAKREADARAAARARRAERAAAAGQRLISSMLPAAPPPEAQQRRQAAAAESERARRLQQAQQAAVASFWAWLADFVACRAAPRQWSAQVPAQHPFLCTVPDDADPRTSSVAAGA
ncbi:hypothetical protein HT031_006931 [Scenedesmus sp. PABB004]|nr:hypothetical protein HT031_006930 [Scenedesmus sp. PABB004]KAF8054789.1 hypothetical protein HT031_006931 [Scenedesmus sp. PABB004]